MFKMIQDFVFGFEKSGDIPIRVKVGLVLYLIGMLFCGMEMVPGWGLFDTGWQPLCFWAIGVLIGMVAGGLICEKALIPGMVGGAAAAMSGLFCLQLLLDNVEVLHSVIAGIVLMVGSFPGVCIGYWLNVALKEDDHSAQAPSV